jgi:Arc/MetJ family transcription regulator
MWWVNLSVYLQIVASFLNDELTSWNREIDELIFAQVVKKIQELMERATCVALLIRYYLGKTSERIKLAARITSMGDMRKT